MSGVPKKGGFQKGDFGGCSWKPKTETRVQKRKNGTTAQKNPEQGHIRRNCPQSTWGVAWNATTWAETAEIMPDASRDLEKSWKGPKGILGKDNPENTLKTP